MTTPAFIIVGRVRKAHGIRGEVVVETITDAPDAIFAAGRRVFAGTRAGDVARGSPEMRIVRSSPFKGGLIIAFEGIESRDAAERWRDRYFLVPANEVTPPADDEVFVHDLIGMRVVRASEGGDPQDIGEVVEVFDLPQGLMMEVAREAGKTVMLPFDDHTVTEVDSDQRIIRVDPVEGLLD